MKLSFYVIAGERSGDSQSPLDFQGMSGQARHDNVIPRQSQDGRVVCCTKLTTVLSSG